jgi:hypothetical protein
LRVLLAVVALASLAVFVGRTDAAPPNVRGTLTRGPVLPVCIEGRPCERPAVGVVLVFSKGAIEIRRVTTGPRGAFGLRLDPGVYSVRVARKLALGSTLTPSRFRVPRSTPVVLRLSMDTGIR